MSTKSGKHCLTECLKELFMKYKVIYKSNNKLVTIYFRNLRCANELAEMTDGIVLNAKGA